MLKGVLAYIVLLAMLAGSARADRCALIFMSSQAAGPNADIHTYVHNRWVLWPAATGEEGSNRILSIRSGVDWVGEPSDLAFRSKPNTSDWVASNYVSLRRRGYFDVWPSGGEVFAIRSASGSVNPACLIVAANADGTVKTRTVDEPLPEDCTLVSAAKSWDEARKLSLRVERTMIIEMPTPSVRWSRMWLWGGWTPDLPAAGHTPGLIPASELWRFLKEPDRQVWVAPPRSWQGANRWLEFVRTTGVVALGFLGLVAIALLAMTVVALANERRSVVLQVGLRVAMLAPAASLLASEIAFRLGLPLLWLALCVSLPAMFFLSGSFKPRSGLFGIAAVTIAACTVCDPAFSVFSNELGHVRSSFCAPWLAFVLTASSLMILEARYHGGWARYLLATAFVGPFWVSYFWFRQDAGLLIILFMLMFLLSLTKLRVLAPAISLAPFYIRHTWVWTPGGLLTHRTHDSAIDASKYVLFLVSPGFVALAIAIMLLAVLAPPFFWHRARTVWRGSLYKPMFAFAGLIAIAGIPGPQLLTTAYYVFFASLLALSDEALRTL